MGSQRCEESANIQLDLDTPYLLSIIVLPYSTACFGCFVMQPLLRQLVGFSLVAAYLVVTTAGSALHHFTCCDGSESHTSEAQVDASQHNAEAHCCQCSHSSSQEDSEPSDAPEPHDHGNHQHDSDSCLVCQDLAAAQHFVAITTLPHLADTIDDAPLASASVDLPLMGRSGQSRAPPA